MLKKILMLALFSAFITNAAAGEQLKICGRYYRPSYESWSKTYKLTAYRLNGTELNQTVSSADYRSSQQYVVISWKRNDYTAIAVPPHWTGLKETVLEDQTGRSWRIVKGWRDCNKAAEP